jgi:hypothetical protein
MAANLHINFFQLLASLESGITGQIGKCRAPSTSTRYLPHSAQIYSGLFLVNLTLNCPESITALYTVLFFGFWALKQTQ